MRLQLPNRGDEEQTMQNISTTPSHTQAEHGGLVLRQGSVISGGPPSLTTSSTPGSTGSSVSSSHRFGTKAHERRKSRQGVLNFKEKFKANFKLLPQFTITDARVVNDPDDQVASCDRHFVLGDSSVCDYTCDACMLFGCGCRRPRRISSCSQRQFRCSTMTPAPPAAGR